MKIDIEVRGFALTEHLRGYVRQKLYNRLGWYADRIEQLRDKVLQHIGLSAASLSA